MRYAFHPEALIEYAEAVQYYARQRVEIAQVFISAIEDAVQRIRESPERFAVIDEDVRRRMTVKFPYGVLYTIEQGDILILAVMHFSREPGYWKSRK